MEQTSLSEAESTASRLARTTGVQRFPNPKLDLFIHKNFLDEATCTAIIERIDANRRPSTIADDKGDAYYRTSETCDLDPNDPVVAAVDSRICSLLGIPPEFGELVQGQRYDVGQEFKPHTDTFNPGGYDFYVHTEHGGQRTWTAMLYLNEPQEGGATRFKTINKTIHPETGKMLMWNNLKGNGEPNEATLHQGMKVRRGVKYVITKWFRERPRGT